MADAASLSAPLAAKHLSPALAWGAMALGLAISAALILLGPHIAMMAPVESEAGITALIYVAIFMPMVVIGLVFARIDGFSALRAGEATGRWAAAGLATGVIGLGLAATFAALAGSLIAGQGTALGASILLGVLLILFQTGSEELFFRGWLFKALDGRIGPWAAIGLSALLFTGFHILGGARTPMSLLNLLLGGIWFGLLAWRSGGLVAPLLAHFGWNATEELVAGLSPNPGSGVFGALMDWDLVGNPLWGGTEEGLNTSIGMAVVLVALILPLAWHPAAPAVTTPDPVPA